MKSPLVLFAMVLLGVGASACGSEKSTNSRPHAASNAAETGTAAITEPGAYSHGDYTKADSDKDNDIGTPNDTDNGSVLDFALPASATDKRAITAVIKRYYMAAAAADGAQACSLLYITFAEAIPEDYGVSPPGQPYMRGNTCPAVMTGVFKHFHRQIAADDATLKVTRVRLEEHHGFAVLSFGGMPQREIPVRLERHAWKIESMLDNELP